MATIPCKNVVDGVIFFSRQKGKKEQSWLCSGINPYFLVYIIVLKGIKRFFERCFNVYEGC